MISEAIIKGYLEDEVIRRDLFLVEVAVRPVNKIAVFVDSFKGVTLEECIGISRYLESKLDRSVEDFELEVSSPGLDKPLKLPVQFEKNKGRMLDVGMFDGIKVTGKLLEMKSGVISLETETRVKDSTGKKKLQVHTQEIKLEEIKSAKIVISLKKK